MAIRRPVSVRLTEAEREMVLALENPRQGRERGVSGTLRQLVYEEARRRSLWPPREQAKEVQR